MLSVKLVLVCVAVVGAVAAGAEAVRAANPVVAVETSMGTFKVELYQDKAPITVKNFLDYVEAKHYDGLIFHRVMGKENNGKDFMVQGGGFSPGMKKEKETKAPIKNEAANGVSNVRGTIAMARTNDPDSATSQFFINVADNKFLDKNERSAGYAAFGRVVEGMDVVDKMKAVKTHTVGPHGDVPVEDIVIKSVKRVEEKK